ncbi:MAG: type II and III secretion system protein family protein [Methylocystis sp.]|nr:type II and III secretion system protein family protein [Methylocystis sp.]
MTRSIFGFVGVVAATLVAAAGAAPLALSQDRWGAESSDGATLSRRIAMGVGKSIIVDLPGEAAEIVVGNPKVANAVVRSTRKLYVMGVDSGQTTIFAVDRVGRQIANLEISIGRDVGELGPLLKAALPKSNIVARTVNDSIILTGTVSAAGEAQRAVDIAKGFATRSAAALPGAGAALGGAPAADGLVVNALTIQNDDQVMLKVTVAEIERKVIKQLGFSADAIAGETILNGAWGRLIQDNPFVVNKNLANNSALIVNGPNGTAATLKAFERYGVSRVLAEPTVTAVSGEAAKLTVGGEIAVPGAYSCVQAGSVSSNFCAPSIIFKPYGVSLNFSPVVVSEGRILLHLAAEVTEVDLQTTFTYANVAVPGFKTRKNETTIELPSGGSIATAGLLTQKSDQVINGLPGLLNLPILGALFRSRDYQRNETDLLIVVTPYIVKAVSSHEVSRPDDGFAEASDPQAWLLGRVNRLYASRNNPQMLQKFKGRIGFIQD